MTTKVIRRRSRNATPAVIPSNIKPVAPSDVSHTDLQLQIRYVATASLKPARRRLRRKIARQQCAVESAMRAFGFMNPILIDQDNQIVCGHNRWAAAQKLGLEQVPVIVATHLSSEELRLYAINENRCGELGEWDPEALKLEFEELPLTAPELNLELSNFTMSEIDDLLVEGTPRLEGEGEQQPPDGDPVTMDGDLWILGNHRLYCGNALHEASYQALMGDERAQMIFTDAPYNLSSKTISGLGKVQHQNFKMASGEMTREEFTTFLKTSSALMTQYSADGSIHFQCMDWKHQREMLDAGEAVYTELKNLVIWNKGTGGMGSFYRSQHELIYCWKHGKARNINNFGLGETGRYRTNVWDYRGNNSFHRNRQKELATHATVKPRALVADAIRDCSHRGGIILDPFGGAGTTLLASEHTGRKARLIEIEPRFCDATIISWQEMSGREAVLAATGKSWTEMAIARGIDLAPVAEGEEEWPEEWDCEHGAAEGEDA